MAIVGSINVPQQRLLEIVKELEDSNVYFIRSKIDQIEFGIGKELLISEGLWETGRLFNNDYEIRWRLDDDQYQITMLTEKDEMPSILQGVNFDFIENGWNTQDTKIILWGKYKDYGNDNVGFLEVRIPKFLNYPKPVNNQWHKDNEAVINGTNYLKDGMILYTRFREVAKNVG